MKFVYCNRKKTTILPSGGEFRKGGKGGVKRIVISMRSQLYGDGITQELQRTGDFHPYHVAANPAEQVVTECCAVGADILLMDVTPSAKETTMEGRLQLIERLHKELPDCKTAILCDAVSHPEQAREVMRAKQAGLIDAFYYTSVSLEYLTAALDAI